MEIQEIKIDGITYIPIDDKCTGSICDECALNGKCVLIDIPELDERINPCGLFGSNKSLEVKDSVMSRHVSLPLWQLERIYGALRLTFNGTICSGRDTAFDRLVKEVMNFVEPLIKENH